MAEWQAEWLNPTEDGRIWQNSTAPQPAIAGRESIDALVFGFWFLIWQGHSLSLFLSSTRMSPEASQAGRKAPSFYTNHFTRGEKKAGKSKCYYWSCNYCGDEEGSCGAKLEGRDNIPPNHLPDSRSCPNVPSAVRNKALRHMAGKKKTSDPDKAAASQTGSNISIFDVDATNELTAVAPRKKRKALNGTLDGYIDQVLSPTQQNSADRKLFRAEDPYLSEFLHDLRPSYDAPKRFPLTHTLLDAEASSKLLTLLQDGWEDRLKRSIYDVIAAGIDSFPIVMSLDDLTGERGKAPKCLDIAVKSLELMGDLEARNFIALTTDNPTTMQSFHRLNTLVGEICAYPLIKKIITKANRTVTFFNGSHYWGGHVASHQQPLSITCLRPDVQKKTQGLSAVGPDVIEIVLRTAEFWPLLNQLTRIAKPVVDTNGNCESCQATLADCMLDLIRCACTMLKMKLEENEDAGFLIHAKNTFDRHFKMIATPTHWLALFLHPLCRKLAVSNTAHGRSLDFMIEMALKLALQWKWSAQKAMQLKTDLKTYYQCKSPFAGGERNTREWWEGIPKENHEGIRSLVIILASIFPILRMLNGFSRILHDSSEHGKKTGKIRSRLTYELYLAAKAKAGKVAHRNHKHMHTQTTPGINADLTKDLENPTTWIPPLEGDENDAEDLVDKAYQDLQRAVEDEEPLALAPGSIINGELVDFSELERVDRGEAITAEDECIEIIGETVAGGWSVEELMQG
ncbi:hypothetical protein C8R44DRAFT_754211 [Mycena epipterygia]|nr:hypothetical protein C8R44DRAFT_754211 [Mycena epipterygia]